MFEELIDEEQERQKRRPLDVLKRVLQSRILQGLVFVLVLLGLAGAGGWWWLDRAMLSDTCDSYDDVELTIEQMIALKNKRKAYRLDKSDEAYLALDQDEVNLLLQDLTHFGAWVELHDDTITAHVTSPTKNGCYNLDFEGGLSVRDGVIFITPDALTVGAVDLTMWLGGSTMERQAEEVNDAVLAERVGNLQTMDVVDGEVRIRMEDRWAGW